MVRVVCDHAPWPVSANRIVAQHAAPKLLSVVIGCPPDGFMASLAGAKRVLFWPRPQGGVVGACDPAPLPRGQPCVAAGNGAGWPHAAAARRAATSLEGALMLRTAMAILAAAAISTPLAAQPLTIVEVNAPAVNCVFQPSCTITVSDTVGAVALPYILTPGTAWLQSRIYNSAPGTPAAGKTGYVYRVSLTEASGSADCLLGLVLNFGPVAKLPYK